MSPFIPLARQGSQKFPASTNNIFNNKLKKLFMFLYVKVVMKVHYLGKLFGYKINVDIGESTTCKGIW